MSSEFSPMPEYPFPLDLNDPGMLDKSTDYLHAVAKRHKALGSVGWYGSGAYFAGRMDNIIWQREANKITIDPEEALSRLDITYEDGDLLPGYGIDIVRGQLRIAYDGIADGHYFGTVDRMLEWGEELTQREKHASMAQRAIHFAHRTGFLF